MDESSIPLTSFITPRGQYENIFMSFGLKCSSQSFQRAMDQILRPVAEWAEAYIDDICCHTCKTFADHLEQLEKVLICLQRAGITLKLSKCSFGQKEILYLGFLVGQGKIVPNPSKVQALVDLNEPRTKKGVRSILAMFRFYCHLIPRFSEICIPLSDLTVKSASNDVIFGELEKQAFQKLKQALIDSTGIYSPDYSKPFIVTCDASEQAIAGCLSQIDDAGLEHPIAFTSSKLDSCKRNWSSIERESYACLHSLKVFDFFIYGSEVTLVTDHNPLIYLANCTPKSPKLERWILGLQRWALTIKHRKGICNVVADCLSRY